MPASATSIRVACVQLAAHGVEDADLALAEAVEATDRAATSADLVVLPEAIFPGYVLHEAAPLLRDDDWYARAVEAIGQVAAARRAWVAAGLVRPRGDHLVNSAVLFGPDGATVSTADKAFLWHFDARWFSPGDPGEVVRTPWGALGMVVCADVRMPELPRRLAAEGARLIVDCTALVLSPGGTNAQIEYMLEARARENGAYLAVANKCGTEAGIARYAGRSAIIGPDGARLAEAGAEDPETIVATLDLSAAAGPTIVAETEPDDRGVHRLLSSAPPASPMRIAIASPSAVDPARAAEELAADLTLGRDRVVPDGLAATGEGFVHGGRILPDGSIVDVGGVAVGLIAGAQGRSPEPARALMLAGATVVVWATDGTDVSAFARTRADENRVFVVCLLPDGRWEVIAPSGAVVARGPDPSVDVTLVELPLALAWNKEMAPGTDVVANRPRLHR